MTQPPTNKTLAANSALDGAKQNSTKTAVSPSLIDATPDKPATPEQMV